MNETFETFCPECNVDVSAAIESHDETITIRGEDVTYVARIAVCPLCHGEIGDSRLEDRNLQKAYGNHCLSHGIMSPAQVAELRARYGLSLREFSRFLGFGEQTVTRYESGSIPSESNSIVLGFASTPEGAKHLLRENRAKLSGKSEAKVERFIASNSDSNVEDVLSPVIDSIITIMREPPSPINGFRCFDIARVSALVSILADRCPELYVTKLQKAMFYCNFLCFERTTTSLTGLVYAHADYGPVAEGRECILAYLTSTRVIECVDNGWGEVVIPKSDIPHVFTDNEISLIDEVAHFVNAFDTAKDLSDYSRKLDIWSKSRSGSRLYYTQYIGEISRAIDAVE